MLSMQADATVVLVFDTNVKLEFLQYMESENLNLEQIHISMSKEDALEQLRRMYL